MRYNSAQDSMLKTQVVGKSKGLSPKVHLDKYR